MSGTDKSDRKGDVRAIADRLILASSLLLIVLTVIFSAFMSAEKFWQGQAITMHITLAEANLTDTARRDLEDKERSYRDDEHAQAHYGQVFAGILSLVMILTAACFPVGIWHASPGYLRVITAVLMAVLGSTGVYALGYAFGCISP